MKKQQVISRFFAPKAASSSPSPKISTPHLSTAETSSSAAAISPPGSSTTLPWPPQGFLGGSSSLRSLKQDVSITAPKKRAHEEVEDEAEEIVPQELKSCAGNGHDGSLKAAPLRKKRAVTRNVSAVAVSQLAGSEVFEESVHKHHQPLEPQVVLSVLKDSKSPDQQIRRKELDDDAVSDRISESDISEGETGHPYQPVEEERGPSSLYIPPVIQKRKIWERHDGMVFPARNPARHKIFVEKLLVRPEERGAVENISDRNPPPGKVTHTPLELQVVELKERFPDVLLMIEVGYKYRFFGDDAETAARVLGIFAFYKHNFLTASIPTFRLHVHVRRLVEAGYKVGVVRQTETAAIKAHGTNRSGPFRRGLSALYTRATLEAAEDLGGDTEGHTGRLNSYLMCIAEQPVTQVFGSSKEKKVLGKSGSGGNEDNDKASYYDTRLGIVAVEISTGDVMFGDFKDTVMRNELEARLLTCSPAELLLATPLSSATEKLVMEFAGPTSEIRVERVPRDCFKDGGALAEVVTFYKSKGDQSSLLDLADSPKEEKVDAGLEAVMAMPDIVLQALALGLRYLRQFGLERVLRLGASFRSFAGLSEMSLSPNTLRQLEILRNSADGTEKGSLLWLMDQTHTAFGARLLRHWVTHPLQDRELIAARLDAVTEIAESMGSVGVAQGDGSYPGSGKGGGHIGSLSRGRVDAGGKIGRQGLLASLLMSLGKLPDVQRGITRIFLRTATAAEFVSVIQGLITAAKQLGRLHFHKEEVEATDVDNERPKGVRSILLKRLLAAASSIPMSEHAAKLLSALNTDAAVSGDKLNLFHCRDGTFPEVAQCRLAIKAREQQLEDLLPNLRKLLRLPRLEYMSVAVTSHLLEVPVAQKVPAHWMKVNSTKKMNRFHPPEVLEGLDTLALAKEELNAACGRAWDTFLAEFASHYIEFRAAVQALASLDCLHSLAVVSRSQGYIRPEFVEEWEHSQLMIKDGRHPVLESTLQDGFVPNDTFLQAEKERCQIITGPNMGGKSCYIRQVALIAIMAQVGSYVPASTAKLHVVDAVFTRMGASDSIQKGSSTFFEELSETSAILQRATSRSLVIIDELGRGTSTHDGVAIAYATLQHLLTETRCLTLFVTHYPKIAELKDKFPGEVSPYFVSYLAEDSSAKFCKSKSQEVGLHVQTKDNHQDTEYAEEATQKITFLYKLVLGVASRSFGLHVARLAQVPEACVLQAAAVALKLEREVSARAQEKAFSLQMHLNEQVQFEPGHNNVGQREESDMNVVKETRYCEGGSQSILNEECKDSFIRMQPDDLAKFITLIERIRSHGDEADALSSLKEVQDLAHALL